MPEGVNWFDGEGTQGTARLLAREGAWLEASWSEQENVGGGAGSRDYTVNSALKSTTLFCVD